jgi:hypothetical protein
MGPIVGIPRLPTWPAGVPGADARLTAQPSLQSEVLHFEAIRVVVHPFHLSYPPSTVRFICAETNSGTVLRPPTTAQLQRLTRI